MKLLISNSQNIEESHKPLIFQNTFDLKQFKDSPSVANIKIKSWNLPQ